MTTPYYPAGRIETGQLQLGRQTPEFVPPISNPTDAQIVNVKQIRVHWASSGVRRLGPFDLKDTFGLLRNMLDGRDSARAFACVAPPDPVAVREDPTSPLSAREVGLSEASVLKSALVEEVTAVVDEGAAREPEIALTLKPVSLGEGKRAPLAYTPVRNTETGRRGKAYRTCGGEYELVSYAFSPTDNMPGTTVEADMDWVDKYIETLNARRHEPYSSIQDSTPLQVV